MQGSYREILSLKELNWEDTHPLLSEFTILVKAYDSVQKENRLMPNNIVHLDFRNLDLMITDKMLEAVFKIKGSTLKMLKKFSMPDE